MRCWHSNDRHLIKSLNFIVYKAIFPHGQDVAEVAKVAKVAVENMARYLNCNSSTLLERILLNQRIEIGEWRMESGE